MKIREYHLDGHLIETNQCVPPTPFLFFRMRLMCEMDDGSSRIMQRTCKVDMNDLAIGLPREMNVLGGALTMLSKTPDAEFGKL